MEWKEPVEANVRQVCPPVYQEIEYRAVLEAEVSSGAHQARVFEGYPLSAVYRRVRDSLGMVPDYQQVRQAETKTEIRNADEVDGPEKCRDIGLTDETVVEAAEDMTLGELFQEWK